jgi:integrase
MIGKHEVVDDISGGWCLEYREAREGAGVCAWTVRTELEALRAALHWAMEKDQGPLIAIMPTLELPAKGHGRDRWLTRAEAEALLAGCDRPHVRLFVLIALYTASRKTAILKLRWT